MSTNCNIAILYPAAEDGTRLLKEIYCHFDGYEDRVGKLLIDHYNSLEKAEDLLLMGNVSSLRPRINPEEGLSEKDVTIFYIRDKNELPEEEQMKIIRIKNGTLPYVAHCFYYILTVDLNGECKWNVLNHQGKMKDLKERLK